MKKTKELTGALLDYWTAMAGEEWKNAHQLFPTMTLDPTFSGVELRDYPRGEYGASMLTCVLIPSNPFRQDPQPFCPSIAWEQGGPIIDREKISTAPLNDDVWVAFKYEDGLTFDLAIDEPDAAGKTPLEAAMRAFVSSKFGDEVPDQPGA